MQVGKLANTEIVCLPLAYLPLAHANLHNGSYSQLMQELK